MKGNTSKVGQYVFPYPLSNNSTFAKRNNIRGLAKVKYWLKIFFNFIKAYIRLYKTLIRKECYYGPFKGEYGHFLAHTLPFLMYLHSKGVRIHYCGMELHKPLLVDECGRFIIHKFYPLRDFFAEVSPNSNSTIPPKDVLEKIKAFEEIALKSGLPFWNIGDDYYYWFIHRHFVAYGHTKLYDLSKVYKTKDEFSCAIFPRSKGSSETHNNGKQWDYSELIETISPYFDKVYVCGHPSQCFSINPGKNVELVITHDNAKILEACSNSSLIITQHSGVNNLGEYLNKQVLIIYKGGNKVEDIGSMNNTLYFRKSFKEKKPLAFAFSVTEIVNYIESNKDKLLYDLGRN